jgi:hypothetical protein
LPDEVHRAALLRVTCDLDRRLVQNSPQGTPFECPFCFLSALDPLNHLVKWVIPPDKLESGKTYWLKLSKEDLETVLRDPAVEVEVRCIKLDSHSRYLTRFPDRGSLICNDNKSKTFSPVDVMTSVKYRKDLKLKLLKQIFTEKQSPSLVFNTSNLFDDSGKNSTVPDQPYYIFGVAIVRLLNQASLLERVRQTCSRSLAHGKLSIMEYFRQINSDINSIQISEEKITVFCPLSAAHIEFPGKVPPL